MAAFPGWATSVLRQVGARPTRENLRALIAWQRAEGGGAKFNPLNTTQSAPGASSYNSVGVRNFVSPQQGIQATSRTLLNGRYGNIVGLLRSGRANARQIATAVEKSPWGTGGGVLRVLGAGPVQLPPPRLGGNAPRAPHTSPVVRNTDNTALRQALMGTLIARQNALLNDQEYTGPSLLQTMAQASLGGQGTPSPGPIAPRRAGGQVLAPVRGRMPDAALMRVMIKEAQRRGLRASENPLVDHVDPVHVKGSDHYRTFPGTHIGHAVDVSGNAQAMKNYFLWASRYAGKGLKDEFYDPMGYSYDQGKRWNKTIGHHNDHVHVSVF